MEGDYTEGPKKGEPLRPPTYTHCYSHKLESLVEKYLAEDYRDRPSLRDLIDGIDFGMESWEGAYGSANVADPPEFMSFDRVKEEQFPIGSVAPEEWNSLPRKRKSDEGGSASIKKSKHNKEPRSLQDKSQINAPAAKKDNGHVPKRPEPRVVLDEDMRRVLGEKEKRPEHERLEKAAQDTRRKGKTTNDLLDILGEIGEGREEDGSVGQAKDVGEIEETRKAEEAKLPKRPTMEKFTSQE